MVARKEGMWMSYAVTAIVALTVSGALACASVSEPPSQPMAVAADQLTDVHVETADGATSVTLEGLVDPIYTAFLHAEPRALVLDLSSVEIATINDLVMVYDGLVDHVTVSTYGGGSEALARVEIALSQDASYEIVETADGLQAILRPGQSETAEMSEAAEVAEVMPVEEDPWSDPAAVEVQDDLVADEAELELAEPAPLATELTGITAEVTDGGVLVHVAANGTVWAMETFTLADPDRLVVDLPGMKSNEKTAKIQVDSPLVAGVRLGAHPDKMRIVVDGGEEASGFEERRVTPGSDGLYLAIGHGDALDAALAAALSTSSATQLSAAELDAEAIDLTADTATPADAAEIDAALEAIGLQVEAELSAEAMVSPVSLATVYGIHYDSQDSQERVVILSDELVDYNLLEPDAETIVVSIPHAQVSAAATGRVPVNAGRPISLISSFQQPDVETPEVRVVVKRATHLEPTVTRRGSMIFIDFPNTGLVAAPPPAFAPELDGPMRTELESASAGTQELAAGTSDVMMAESAGEMGESTVAMADDTTAAEMSSAELMADAESMPASAEAWAEPEGASADLYAAAPAALEPPAASEILEEGGLIDGKRYEGRRISLDFKDVPVADVLRLIAEVSDLNLIAGDEVDGNVTIRLVDVPWDQALDVILLTKGLGFVRVGNVLRIAPGDIIKAEEELRLQERRNKETLEDLMVKLQPVNYANVKDMSELVTRLLTPRGTVNVDVRTNTLIIKDIASVIDEATALVKAIDTETPQVMIEAKIVEASLDFSRELGSTWSVGTNELKTDLGSEDFRPFGENNIAFGNPITAAPTALMNMNAFILDTDFNVGVQIAAAESTGDGKVISSPRVLTLDNREAFIQQGVSIPFQTFENGDSKIEFIDAVLSLLVTPHVTSDKTIIMQIEVTRNAPDPTVQTNNGAPGIRRAETRTETLVKDGQTMVIGGIYSVEESERSSRVPYLHRLPILGAAFRSKEVSDGRKELLVFVTPRIVVASELAGS